MFIMIFSSGMFAFIINDIGKIVSNIDILAAEYREKMLYVDIFLKQQQIPKDLRF